MHFLFLSSITCRPCRLIEQLVGGLILRMLNFVFEIFASNFIRHGTLFVQACNCFESLTLMCYHWYSHNLECDIVMGGNVKNHAYSFN